MGYLFLSILSSTCIYLLFQLLQDYKVNTFQTIVFNYFFCVLIGLFLLEPGKAGALLDNPLGLNLLGLAVGLLFIVVFYLMARTTQLFGVAAASIVSRMSLVVPTTFAIIAYNEAVTWAKVAGVVIGLVAIYFIIYRKSKTGEGPLKTLLHGGAVIFPVLAFIGSGLTDTLVQVTEEEFLQGQAGEVFTVLLFGTSFISGLLLLGGQRIHQAVQKKESLRISGRSIIWSIPLGVVNYFSIYLFLLALSRSGLPGSMVFPLNHISVVALSTLVAALLFHQHLNPKNRLGFALSILAILLLTLGEWSGLL